MVDLDPPAVAIQFGEVFRGVVLGVRQRGRHDDRAAAVAGPAHLKADRTDVDDLGEWDANDSSSSRD